MPLLLGLIPTNGVPSRFPTVSLSSIYITISPKFFVLQTSERDFLKYHQQHKLHRGSWQRCLLYGSFFYINKSYVVLALKATYFNVKKKEEKDIPVHTETRNLFLKFSSFVTLTDLPCHLCCLRFLPGVPTVHSVSTVPNIRVSLWGTVIEKEGCYAIVHETV